MRPNLFLIGAAKSGTTSLADLLDQHPEVLISKPKEPNFFAYPSNQRPTCIGPVDSERLYEVLLRFSITDLTEYEKLFEEASGVKAAGEASVRYLYYPDSPTRIAQYAPDARILAILRNPIDRLYSHYFMNVRSEIEPEPLRRALELEDERVDKGWGWDWHYARVGQYARQLRRYYDLFGVDRILVVFYEELAIDPEAVLRLIFKHLGVDTEFHPEMSHRLNVGHTVKYPLLRQLMWKDNPIKTVAKTLVPQRLRSAASNWVETRNRRSIPKMDDQLRAELSATFASDIDELRQLIGRDVPW